MRSFLNNHNMMAGFFLATGLLLASTVQAEILGRDGKPIFTPPKATSELSNCYFGNGGLGCDNPECEATVCASDTFCCDVAWDSQCADEAAESCPVEAVDNGDRAVFHVNKVFVDGNPAEATVTLSCFTGLPLVQSQQISNSKNVSFVVQSYADGALDCSVSEDPVPDGYSASYAASALGTDDADGCHFEDLALGADLHCVVSNIPAPVEVSVNKDWVIDGSGGDQLDPTYELTLWCYEFIEGGTSCDNPVLVAGDLTQGESGGDKCEIYQGSGYYYKVLTPPSGAHNTDDETYTAFVLPDWKYGNVCWVEEEVVDGTVEVNAEDCEDPGDIRVFVNGNGGDEECTIVNTVFYEGIPTLSQYGAVLLAMLMLGIGFVGFRRFS